MQSTFTLKGGLKFLKGISFALLLLCFTTGSLKAQYCATTVTFQDELISNVTFNGTLSNPSTGFGTAGYQNFTAFPGINVNQGGTLTVATTYAPQYGGDQVFIWIDYNNDLDFLDAGEQVFTSQSTVVQTEIATILVPTSVSAGPKRMRIRLIYQPSNPTGTTACGTTTYGQVEDYTINVLATPPCSGTPTPGNTISSVASICPGIPFNLSLQNATAGTGVTYQFQQSSTGVAGSFTNIGPNTSPTYTVPAGITATTYYQAIVTCGTNPPATSIPVTVALTPPSGCYCASSANFTGDEDIFRVQFGTLDQISTCATTAPGFGSVKNRYSNYTSGTGAPTAPDVAQGAPYTLSVTVGQCNGFQYTNSVAVFIDYNQNGSFLDAGEKVYNALSGSTVPTPFTHTAPITIPATAVLGQTRMRVVNVETGTPGGILPCGTYGYGETEDYTINIIPCVPLTVTTQPTPQTVVCGGTATFNIATTGTAPNYQFQIQPASGGTFTNVPNSGGFSGGNTNTLTITGVTPAMNGSLIRVVYSGGCTSTNFSNAVALTVTPIAPSVSQSPTSLCTGATGASAIQTITVTGGGTAVFTPSTDLFTDAAATMPYTGTAVTVVYAKPAATTTYSVVRTNGACVSTTGTVTVTVNNPLAGTPTLSPVFDVCANGTSSLSVTGITGGAALGYQFQVSTDGGLTYNNISNGTVYSGVTTSTLTILNPTTLISGLMYRVVVSSASCGTGVNSNPSVLSVNPTPVITLSAIPNQSVSPLTPVTLSVGVASGTAPFTYQYFLNGNPLGGSSTSNTLAVDANNVGDYSVRVTDAKGCTVATSTTLNITASATNTLFIYPSPNNGKFQVRYFNGTALPASSTAAMLNVYDSKGTRVFTQRYSVNGPFTQMNVNLGTHGAGIYRIEVSDSNGDRLKTGSVMVF
ncbi:MAG: GEVED domain-containing protein [Ferruginibacter sp.]